mmetsp:Transcript_26027/g.61123  ORF Transcript_26027/g.61123 Transcript_26027/m.61123 type:complete len:96 (+) Transcript_26027:2452-2739(+)
MKSRRNDRPMAELTNPVQAVGIEHKHNTTAIGIRAPHLSQAGPKTTRMNMVPKTLAILEVQISSSVSSRSSRISLRSGDMANQMKKAMKKPHQEQ